VTTTTRDHLKICFDTLLEPARFKDYGPNGLQVEGKTHIRRLISGVTASLALIEAAIEAKADAILVHHGLFWRGQSGVVTGWMRKRLAQLLAHDINLFAYHLPLDAHPQFGNNAQLGLKFGWTWDQRFGDQDLGMAGILMHPTTAKTAQTHIEAVLQRPALLVLGDGRAIQRVAWCSGGAQSYFEAAIEAGADLYVTGEISEPQAHLARETGVAFIACGHHASERYGAPALAEHVCQQLGIAHEFIDCENPA
jgi:dinuclear metal center YbgI/SA1388 family protein